MIEGEPANGSHCNGTGGKLDCEVCILMYSRYLLPLSNHKQLLRVAEFKHV